MKVKPIRDPVAGERVVAVSPEMAPTVRSEWHRRLNLYPGRTLSHRALTVEQEQRAGRLATHGQRLSPGVISGLEVDLELDDGDGGNRVFVVAPGHGLTATGEDVALPRPLRVDVNAVPVYSATLPIGEATLPPGPAAGFLVLQPVVAELDDELTSDDPCEEDEQNYAFEDWQRVDGCRLVFFPWPDNFTALPAFGERWRNRIAYAIFDGERRAGPDDLLPWEEAGVPIAVVAYEVAGQPLFVDRAAVVRAGGKPKRRTQLLSGTGNPFLWQARIQQFAEQVAEADPQLPIADLAAQLRYLPPVGLLPKHAIDARQQRDHFFPPTYHVTALPVPEEQLDVAVEASAALRPFDTFTPDQVQVLVPVPEIWYEPRLLEIEQVDPEFAETIDRFVLRRARWLRRRDDLRIRAAQLRQSLRGGPPALFALDRADDELPATTRAQLTGGPPPFNMPPNSVLYLEVRGEPQQISFTERNVADLSEVTTDELNELLRVAGVPVFAAVEPTSGRLVLSTTAFGDTKLTVVEGDQSAHKALGFKAGDGSAGSIDPTNPLDPEDPQLSVPEQTYGTAANRGAGGLIVQAIEALRKELRLATPIRRETLVPISKPPDKIPAKYASRVRYDQNRRALAFTGRMTRQEYAELHEAAESPEVAGVFDQLFAGSQGDELSELDRLGLEGFMDLLQGKIDRANDTIDLGFLRVQTDIYRIRQSILGVGAATRLATSPMLAGIAKGDTAVATRESLSRFLESTKDKRVDPTSPNNQIPTPTPDFFRAGAIEFEPRSLSGAQEIDAASREPSGEKFAPETSSRGMGTFGPTAARFDPTTQFDPQRLGGAIFDPTTQFDPQRLGGAVFDPIRQRDAERLINEAIRQPTPVEITPTRTPSPRISLETAQFQSPFVTAAEIFRDPSKDDIVEQPPIIGKAYDFRTTTIAERLEKSESLEAKAFTVSSKYAVVNNLSGLDLNLDDLKVPGFLETNPNGQRVPVERDFWTIKTQGLAGQILQGVHDPDPVNGDEAAFFATGIKAIDYSVAMMRVIEGRIQSYKNALELCRKTLATIRDLLAQLDRRLSVIGGELAEARHDVAVARALLAEEQSRVAAINQRRDTIIAEQVRYLVFQRPRTTELRRDTPIRSVDPGAVEPVLPACLNSRVVVPPPLRAMVDLLREVPLNWFPRLPLILDQLDRLPALQSTFHSAKLRAQTHAPGAQVASQVMSGSGKLGQSISNVFVAQQQLVSQYRAEAAQFDLARLNGQSWQAIRNQAGAMISLGDLIDADHGRSDVAQRASIELNNMAQVATCLYSMFAEVLPVIRLDWAERLSQYDRAVDLRNLSSLPRWGEIELLDRRAMQALVDWLFQQIESRQSQAVALLNDLIRICILLASHAPVNAIVAGRVTQPTIVTAGSRVEVTVDLSKVHIGMSVLLYNGPSIVARGVVEDLTTGKVAARVLQITTASAAQASVQLDRDAQVQFSDATTLDRTAAGSTLLSQAVQQASPRSGRR